MISSEFFKTVRTITHSFKSCKTTTNSCFTKSAGNRCRWCFQLRSKGSVFCFVSCISGFVFFLSHGFVRNDRSTTFLLRFSFEFSCCAQYTLRRNEILSIAKSLTVFVLKDLTEFSASQLDHFSYITTFNFGFRCFLERQIIDTPWTVRHCYLVKHLKTNLRIELFNFVQALTSAFAKHLESSHVCKVHWLETLTEPSSKAIKVTAIGFAQIKDITYFLDIDLLVIKVRFTITIKSNSFFHELFKSIQFLMPFLVTSNSTVLNHPKQRDIFVIFLSQILVQLVSTIANSCSTNYSKTDRTQSCRDNCTCDRSK